ncbi:nucleotidyltransferase family protein [Bdellovibrio sp. HCB274]|uniref:nucleotidyltransferase family protein n=1 Tax=Bdellovibrio sp. HCB274 TaxID=3394361 RepID=UPI0039B4FA96
MGTTELETKTLVLLAGGKASRLNEFLNTDSQIKCLVRFGDVVFIDLLLRQACEAGIEHVILLAGPARESIKAHLANGDYNMQFSFPDEETRLGTGGALSLIAPFVKESRFILSNADTFFAENPFQTIQRVSKNQKAVFLVSPKENHEKSGFLANSQTSQWQDLYNTPGYCYAGVAMLSSDLVLKWQSLNLPETCSFERDVFPKIKNDVKFYKCDFSEIDFGTAEGFRRLQTLLREVV